MVEIGDLRQKGLRLLYVFDEAKAIPDQVEIGDLRQKGLRPPLKNTVALNR